MRFHCFLSTSFAKDTSSCVGVSLASNMCFPCSSDVHANRTWKRTNETHPFPFVRLRKDSNPRSLARFDATRKGCDALELPRNSRTNVLTCRSSRTRQVYVSSKKSKSELRSATRHLPFSYSSMNRIPFSFRRSNTNEGKACKCFRRECFLVSRRRWSTCASIRIHATQSFGRGKEENNRRMSVRIRATGTRRNVRSMRTRSFA